MFSVRFIRHPIFFLNNSGEIDKLVSGETKLGEWSDLIHHVPLLVVITGTIIFIISFAGRTFIINSQFYMTMMYKINRCTHFVAFSVIICDFFRLHWCVEGELVPPKILFYINASHFSGSISDGRNRLLLQ